jgi:hypothetical protein
VGEHAGNATRTSFHGTVRRGRGRRAGALG